MIRGVFFDLDNTLMDRNKCFNAFVTKLVEDFFPHITDNNLRREIINVIKKADNHGYTDKEKVYDLLLQVLPWEKALSKEEFRNYWEEQYLNCVQPISGLAEVLDELRGNIEILGIITNGQIYKQNKKIDILGIRKYFDKIIISGEIGIHKPDNRIFEYALKQVNLKPEQTVYVGENPHFDILPSAGIGMRAVWIEGFMPYDNLLNNVEYTTVNHLSMVADVIRNM